MSSVESKKPTAAAPETSYRLPSDITLKHAAKLSIVEDKPVLFDYWTDSLDKKALIGFREGSGEKLLVKESSALVVILL